MHPELRFSLAGPLRAWRGGQEVALGTRQQRAVLAALLLNNGAQLSVEQLVGMVWDDPTPTAVMAVRTYVSRLRRVLPDVSLESVDGGYLLRVDPSAVDTEHGPCGSEPLAGLSSRYFDAQRVRLAELRLSACEDRLARDLELGHVKETVAELTLLVADHPLRERLRALLMLGLSRDGRQAEALAVFQDTQALLDEQLGVRPGPELMAMHRRVLLGEVTALPPDVADFTGRGKEIERITRLLTGGRAVGITGLRGAGKTTLAVHIGHQLAGQFPDGQIFLPRTADPFGFLLRTTGAENVPDQPGERVASWRRYVRGKRLLVIADDVPGPGLVRDLMPGVTLLVTSVRQYNEVAGVGWLKVAGFTPQDSLAFLGRLIGDDRVRAERADAQVLAESFSRYPIPLRVLSGRLLSRPGWTIGMIQRQLDREGNSTAAMSPDCVAVIRPLLATLEELTSQQAAAIASISRISTGTVSVELASDLTATPAAVTEVVLEALADAHLLEPGLPGEYQVPEYVRRYFQAAVYQ